MKTRYIIPIYNIDRVEEFNYENKFSNINFKLNLKSYEKSNLKEFKNIVDTNDEKMLSNFFNIIRDNGKNNYLNFTTLLTLDFETKNIDEEIGTIEYFEKSTNVFNYSVIFKSILESFHLILPYGFEYYKYIQQSDNSYPFITGHSGTSSSFGAYQIHTSYIKPYFFSPLVELVVMKLKKEDFVRFEKVLINIYNLNTKESTEYSRIIKQSIDYHILAKTFLNNEQTFVVLMITIESIFKESENEKLYKRMSFLSKLISNNEVEYEEIIYKFKQKNKEQKQNEYFIGIRNSIAHGKEFLERDEMKAKVLELYEYVRRCIIEILDINDKFNLVNYYEDLFKNIEIQWKNKM